MCRQWYLVMSPPWILSDNVILMHIWLIVITSSSCALKEPFSGITISFARVFSYLLAHVDNQEYVIFYVSDCFSPVQMSQVRKNTIVWGPSNSCNKNNDLSIEVIMREVNYGNNIKAWIVLTCLQYWNKMSPKDHFLNKDLSCIFQV